ncbi:RND family transporter [Zobellella sp. DQSA1]|uniref:efflux RND transporter permease subunit n=1 Tax=Zobellella sp. DQSA1 TaxID=3342386 RepID=UPI0035C05589
MTRFITAWAAFVVRFRWLVIATSLTLAVFSLVPAQNIDYDNSNESYFVEGDANLLSFERLLDLFGDVEYLSVGISAPQSHRDVFNEETLYVIHELTEFLEERPEVTQVRSLTKYEYTHSTSAGLATDPLLEDLGNPEAFQLAREIILDEPIALGQLVTEDFRHARITARVRYQVGKSDYKMSLMAALREFIDEKDYADHGYPVRLSGMPVFTEQFEVLTKRDQRWINPTMAVVMIAILYISFRSFAGAVLPWVVIGLDVVWVSGLQGIWGWPHTVVESALVPALIIIGVGISVHVLVDFYRFRAQGLSPERAAEATVEHLWIPAFYTALTTAAGFLALSVTELVPVRQFAWLGAIGALLLFVAAMTTMPAIMSFVHSFSSKTENSVKQGLVARLTAWLPEFTARHMRLLVFSSTTVLVISLLLVPRLNVDSNFITYFKENNPTRADLHYFDHLYRGTQNLDIVIDTGEPGGIHDPGHLIAASGLQDWLERQPETGKVLSIIDFHRQINRALNYGDPEWYALPDSRSMAAQFLLLYGNTGAEEDLSDVKDFEERYLRMSVPITNMPASETAALLNRVESYIDRFHPEMNAELTGGLVMYNAQDNYINQGVFRSFIVALFIIAASFVILFRSVKYGLIALIPSVVPILITGAILVLMDTPLNLGTMIVGAMTMGIAVDDAIHVMNRYLSARRQGEATDRAIHLAMAESGRAVVFTSLILVIGFSIMLLGSFIPYIYTGFFAACIMSLALLGDLLILPALLHWLDGERAATANFQEEALTATEEKS